MRTSVSQKEKIKGTVLLIVEYLVFYLDKKVSVHGSVNSGSAYIYFDNLTVKVSDHNYTEQDIFLDVNMFQTSEMCFRYFVNNYLVKNTN